MDGNRQAQYARARRPGGVSLTLLRATDWGGHAPTIQLEYDEQNEYLHTITVQYNKRIAQRALALTSNELRERIVRLLSEAGVFPPSVDVQLLAGNIPAMSAKDV